MKIVGIFLIIGILFSYIPVMPMDDCPEEHHTGNRTVECGYSFHCPILFNVNVPDPLPLPVTRRFILVPPSLKVDEVPFLIFHPPKTPVANFS